MTYSLTAFSDEHLSLVGAWSESERVTRARIDSPTTGACLSCLEMALGWVIRWVWDENRGRDKRWWQYNTRDVIGIQTHTHTHAVDRTILASR